LKSLFNLLPIRNDYNQYINNPVEFLVDNTYSVTGHPTIVSGIIKSGIIKVNDTLLLGPFTDSTYHQVKVRSIHQNYRDLKEAKAGSYICISLKNITRREIKKGMILISNDPNLKLSVKQFIAQIHILHSLTTIKEGYQPFVHIEHVRQSVKMLEFTKIGPINDKIGPINDKEVNILSSGDKANVKLEFIMRPEYIKEGMRLIFREGKVKAVGKIIQVINL
jgi:GTPase